MSRQMHVLARSHNSAMLVGVAAQACCHMLKVDLHPMSLGTFQVEHSNHFGQSHRLADSCSVPLGGTTPLHRLQHINMSTIRTEGQLPHHSLEMMAGRRYLHAPDLRCRLPRQMHWKTARVHWKSREGDRESLPYPSSGLVSSEQWSECTKSECHGSGYKGIHSCTGLSFGNTINDVSAWYYTRSEYIARL